MSTLAWSWYTDPALVPLERERIFASAWQYVGHLGQLAQPGYFASAVGDIPIVVTRDREGVVRGFLNVCRHRGSVVAAGEGARSSLQCPYHAWTYALDGSLRAAPRAEREGGLNTDELSLRPIQVGTWGALVFANPDLEAPPLADILGRLPELVAEAVDVEGLEFRRRDESSLDANWKLVAENFLECYHCAVAHPGFSAVVDVSPGTYQLEAGESFSSQFGPVRENGNSRVGADGEVVRSQFHFLWPNTMVNIFPGRANLSIGPVLPVGTTRTARFLDYFFAPDADDEAFAELLELDAQVGREDRALVENVQRGVASGLIERGQLLPESERLIANFQRRLRAAIAE